MKDKYWMMVKNLKCNNDSKCFKSLLFLLQLEISVLITVYGLIDDDQNYLAKDIHFNLHK